jgi:hypothetical protein
MDLKTTDLKNWSPGRIYEDGGELRADWIYLGRKRFTEPFHDNTIDILLREPFNLLFRHQTPFALLGEMYETSKGLPPKGFIFHISRCGSTLVSQMLASLPKNVVISEASAIDKVIRADVPDELKTNLLRWLVNALAQKRFPEEENFFIKFDSWSVLDLPLIEKAFPDVPWIFMYRNPVEVIVSNIRQPGAQMIPGAIGKIFPGLGLHEILRFPTEERFARTIAAFCSAALDSIGSERGMLVNYDQLPGAVTGAICRHFGAEFTEDEVAVMSGSSKFDAKSPQTTFSPDSTQKRKEASSDAVRFAALHADPLYDALETFRLENPR